LAENSVKWQIFKPNINLVEGFMVDDFELGYA